MIMTKFEWKNEKYCTEEEIVEEGALITEQQLEIARQNEANFQKNYFLPFPPLKITRKLRKEKILFPKGHNLRGNRTLFLISICLFLWPLTNKTSHFDPSKMCTLYFLTRIYYLTKKVNISLKWIDLNVVRWAVSQKNRGLFVCGCTSLRRFSKPKKSMTNCHKEIRILCVD